LNEIEVQDHVAGYYVDKRYKGIGLKYHSSIIKEMMYGIKGRILDVGCGTGIIHDLYPKLNIYGIDVSSGMLAHYKGKCWMASATDIPFDDNFFDSVVCRSVLHHIPETEKALKEITRVLKPGGKFVCWETNKSWLATLIRRRTQHGDHFSEYHTSFHNLGDLIKSHFREESVRIKYQGFVAYPLLGFPDIIDFSKWSCYLYAPLMRLDEILSNSPLKKLGFAVMIKAVK
jgi:ubiquinone/menaquinone biosynthesis C-methylase UbiE